MVNKSFVLKKELLFKTGAHHLVNSMEASPQRLFYCCNNFLFLLIVRSGIIAEVN